MDNLKRVRAAGPNGLTPEISVLGCSVLVVRLTEILARI